MTAVNRRAFLTWATIVPLGGAALVLAGCTPEPTPKPTGGGASSGVPQDLSGLPEGVRAGAVTETSTRPAVLASFGPNGTHFPADLEWPGTVAATELEVDCSWEAISAALGWLTPELVAAGATIRVLPGQLPGGGNGSGSNPVLNQVGDPAWERSVLIVPRDGYGSVTVVNDGIRLNEVSRVGLFGFTGDERGFVLTQCSNVQIGWGVWTNAAITLGGADVGLFEIVVGFLKNTNDTAAVRPTETFTMVNLERHGCVFGPSVKPEGDASHLDTFQLERTGAGEFGPLLSTDCIDIGSSNAALMIDSTISTVEFRHSMILGGSTPWEIFPLKAGDYVGDSNAISGAGQDLRIYDSVVIGAVGQTTFTQVENSVLSYSPQDVQKPTESGEWTVDESVASWSLAQIEEAAGTNFDFATFIDHWKW